MAITKCLIWVRPSEAVHRSGDGAASVWPHQRWMVHAVWMEKIMSKTTMRNLERREVRELRDDELDGVSGGLDYCKLYPDKCTYVPPPPPPPPHLSAL